MPPAFTPYTAPAHTGKADKVRERRDLGTSDRGKVDRAQPTAAKVVPTASAINKVLAAHMADRMELVTAKGMATVTDTQADLRRAKAALVVSVMGMATAVLRARDDRVALESPAREIQATPRVVLEAKAKANREVLESPAAGPVVLANSVAVVLAGLVKGAVVSAVGAKARTKHSTSSHFPRGLLRASWVFLKVNP